MTLERELQVAKIMLLFDKTIEKIRKMQAELEVVDLPEFAKPKEDRLTTMTDRYITSVIKDNRLDEVLKNLL